MNAQNQPLRDHPELELHAGRAHCDHRLPIVLEEPDDRDVDRDTDRQRSMR